MALFKNSTITLRQFLNVLAQGVLQEGKCMVYLRYPSHTIAVQFGQSNYINTIGDLKPYLDNTLYTFEQVFTDDKKLDYQILCLIVNK